MTAKQHRHQDGFAATGVLAGVVAVAIVGAIAAPMVSGQQRRGQDATAKRAALSLVRAAESCHARERDYAACNTLAELRTPGISFGRGRGQATISAALRDDFVITARSRSGSVFKVTRTDGGALVRSCSIAARGGCAPGGRW